MIAILDVMPVLTVFPYAYIYYAILLISSGLAVFGILRARPSNWSKLLGAFLVVFGLQILLLAFGLLSYQGYETFRTIFPLLHRGLNFLALVWFCWALSSRMSRKGNVIIPLALSILVILAVSLAVLLWLPALSTQSLNATWIDIAWAAASMFVLIISGWLYLRSEDTNPLEAIIVLVIAACGYMLYLALPNTGNLPGAVMISQLLYYPLFIALAWQHHASQPAPAITAQPSSQPEKTPCAGQVAASLLDVSLQESQKRVLETLTRALSLFLMADLCGIVKGNTAEGSASVLHTYDLIREEYLPAFEIDSRQNPLIFSNLRSQIPLIINEETHTNPESLSLMLQTGYNQPGNLLLFPLSLSQESETCALLCLSPYTNRAWTQKDVERLQVVGPKVYAILKRSSQIAVPLSENQIITHVAENADAARALLEKFKTEQQQVQAAHTKEIQLWAERQEWLESQLDILTSALSEKDQALKNAEVDITRKEELEKALEKNSLQIQQLREALTRAQELFEPTVSSEIQSDSPVMTADSVLESQEFSTAGAPVQTQSRSEQPRLGSLLLDELAESLTECEKRGLTIKDDSDFQGELDDWTHLRVREILGLLLENACHASPRGAAIEMGIYAGENLAGEKTVEIHVTDRCGGLSDEEQTRFLKWINRPGYPVPAGIGDVQALRKAAALAQACGGNWWIHSQLGQPTTYRVAIPIHMSPAESGREGL